MKIKLAVSDEHAAELSRLLAAAGIEISDDAEYILTEKDRYVSYLAVRTPGEDGEKLHLAVEDILYIESFGHTVEVQGRDGRYQTTDRLYQLMTMLDPKLFLRVSNSVIINRRQVRRISPTFSQKFILTMKNGDRVDVTRSYYNSFRAYFGI